MIFTKLYKSLTIAIKGLGTVWQEELSFKTQSVVALAIVIGAVYFNFSFAEFILLILGIVIIFAAEIINTAIEDLCNKVEPGFDESIGKIKDMMAAFVLISGLGVIAMGIFVLAHHFFGIGF